MLILVIILSTIIIFETFALFFLYEEYIKMYKDQYNKLDLLYEKREENYKIIENLKKENTRLQKTINFYKNISNK